MIEFHLDARSGIAPYQQLVQQVRHALRLGLLEVGDQLPTVKEVVTSLALNPNTVLKAYKELENFGLVAARPGIGIFVTKTLSDDSLAAHGPLRHEPATLASPGSTRRPRRGEHRGPLSRRRSVLLRRGRSVSAVLEANGLGKRYGRKWALSECTLIIPAGKVVGLVGPNGAGKTTLLQLSVGLLRPSAGSITVLGGRPGTTPDQLARVGFVAQDTPTYAGLSVADHLRFGAWMNPSWDAKLAEDRIERLGLDPRPEGRQALRRSARPARTHPRGREATGAARARRAGRKPRSPRAT